MTAVPPYFDIETAIGVSAMVSIGDAMIGSANFKLLPRSVDISTSLRERMSEYCGTSSTSSYDKACGVLFVFIYHLFLFINCSISRTRYQVFSFGSSGSAKNVTFVFLPAVFA